MLLVFAVRAFLFDEKTKNLMEINTIPKKSNVNLCVYRISSSFDKLCVFHQNKKARTANTRTNTVVVHPDLFLGPNGEKSVNHQSHHFRGPGLWALTRDGGRNTDLPATPLLTRRDQIHLYPARADSSLRYMCVYIYIYIHIRVCT